MQYFRCDKCLYTYQCDKRACCPDCGSPLTRLADEGEKLEYIETIAGLREEGDEL